MALSAAEKDAAEYRSTAQLVRDNEQRHQELRQALMDAIIEQLHDNRGVAVELIHAYNGMPRMG
jgi:hypothetical protein